MKKNSIYTYTKMNQDLSKSKHSPEIYFEGRNIRIITNEAFGSVTNQKGNALKAEIPVIPENPTQTKTHLGKLPYPLEDPKIVGSAAINNDIYFLSKYPVNNEFAKLFYAQVESGNIDNPGPYIDSNIRVLLNKGSGFETFFENFDSTGGAIEGPSLPVGTPVRIQAFSLSSQPNEPAPDPHLYLEIYENGVMVERKSSPLDYINTVTLVHDFVTEPNKVYFFYAYTLQSPGSLPNPFTQIDLNEFIIEADIFTIHKMDKDYNVSLKFIDIYDIGDKKVDVHGFYENQLVQKLYWGNGKDPLSFINIADPDSLELNRNFLSTVPNVNLTQPEITGFSTGGNHTAGSIQYTYNLYKVNGAQTRVSPLSIISYLNSGDRGNQVNTTVDKSVNLKIENIDNSFDRIRIYSIKYNSLNSTPNINIIYDNEIILDNINIVDDNNSIIQNITLSEFLFLGGDVYIPKHLIIKDNVLFLLNYSTRTYDVEFDARAYRFDSDGNLLLKDSELGDITSTSFVVPIDVPEKHACINPTNKSIEEDHDWNKYVWKEYDSLGNKILGGKGPNVAFEIKYKEADSNFGQPTMNSIPTLSTALKASDYKTLKSGEIYRMFLEFLIDDGKFSFPKWVCDIKIPEIGTEESKAFGQAETLTPTPPSTFRAIRISNPPGFPSIGDACSANTSGLTAYIDPTFAITNGLIIYSDTALTTPLYTNDPYSGNFAVLLDDDNNLKYAVNFDNSGVVNVVSSCGSITPGGPGSGLQAEMTKINYCYIETELLNIPNDPRIIGWRTSIVERTDFDKSVITQGLYNPAIEDNFTIGNNNFVGSYFQRTVRNNPEIPDFGSGVDSAKPQRFNTLDSTELNLSTNNSSPTNKTKGEITANINNYKISNRVGNLFTPETILNKNVLGSSSARLRKLGLIRNTFSYSNRQVLDTSGLISQTPGYNQEFTALGATVLMGIAASTEANRIKTSKFISDNKNSSETELFSRRRHAYVRYFGGLYYPRNEFGSLNNISINNRVVYTAPISNLYAIPDPNENVTYNFNPNTGIPVSYQSGVFSEAVYRAFTGSSLTFVGLPENFVTTYNELDKDDPNDFGVLMEVYRIVQNQYGGESYNARQLNRTIPYSNLRPLLQNSKTTEHDGDTFIQKFNFLKTFRSGNGILQSAEIVSFPVETSINLDLRYDIMKDRPDNFDADENTSYGFNLVYNQLNNTVKGIPKPFNFTEINEFPLNVIPSKTKTAGEIIDSFTDFLVNDAKTLDGKYGEITGVGEYNDQVFSFQREAIAYLAINPRVQLSGSDGIQIELGSGRLIERYQYLTTNSGTLNKWSIAKTRNGLMYFDLLNKSLNFIADNELSTVNGIFNQLKTYCETNKFLLEQDDILAGKGVHTFYDNNSEDIYFTFLADNNKFTVSYNGLVQGFVSYYDFHPTNYFKYRNRMLSTIDNKTIWKHEEGNYQSFYGLYYPASVTVLCNPEPYYNKIFNNIGFQAETYLNGVDQSDVTFNKIRVWNEFQDTGLVNLVPTVRPLLKRKFRNWNSIIPRVQNSRDRINNAWSFVKLELDRPEENYKIVLHDLILSYL